MTDKQYDAEGNLLTFDVRDDELQKKKYGEIVELLLAAGYFRARIKGLSEFDKVVGGMCWCITSCNIDVDIDLLFQENATVGQKIALTEKIVGVLLKMKCPHRLEPHQIQGADFIHVFPVMQWLVKRAIETRQEMGDAVKEYGIYLFQKRHKPPKSETEDKALKSLQHINEAYRPIRQFRRVQNSGDGDEDSVGGHLLEDRRLQIQSTLLEYGHRFYSSTSNQSVAKQVSAEKKKIAASLEGKSDGGAASSQDEERSRERELKSLMSGMAEERQSRIGASAVGNILGNQSSQILQYATEYAEKQAALDKEKLVGSRENHERIVKSLEKQLENIKSSIQSFESEKKCLKEKYVELEGEVKEVEERTGGYNQQLEEYEQLLSDPTNIPYVESLERLTSELNKSQEAEEEFRRDCKKERQELRDKISALEESTEPSDEAKAHLAALDAQLEADKAKLQQLRLTQAKKNREIASMQRRLDDIPSRAELNQYQRRFLELYNQVAAMHKETKQFYTLYNTLEDKRLYMNKEVSVINSVHDGWLQVRGGQAPAAQFLKQMDVIVDGVNQNKNRLLRRKEEEKMRRDGLSDKYTELIELERTYYKLVRQFHEECARNDQLAKELKTHSADMVNGDDRDDSELE